MSAARRLGFTLNELLIVVAIMVLVIALAVPAFNVITNSRSVDSAENQVSTFLSGIRAEAIGLQEPRGAIFFEDIDTGRITLAAIEFTPNQAVPVIIDLSAGRDEMVLPNGVGWQSIPEGGGATAQDFPWTPFGVVMFDRDGNLLINSYRIVAAGGTKLWTRLQSLKDRNGGAVSVPYNGRSTIGFAMFDKIAYDEQPAGNRDEWLKENAWPYLVNRYNGTLLKGQ